MLAYNFESVYGNRHIESLQEERDENALFICHFSEEKYIRIRVCLAFIDSFTICLKSNIISIC